MRTVGWTPLKEQSSRLPGKNYRLLGGRPLFAHMVHTLLACPALDEVIVNVDCAQMGDRVRREFGGDVTLVQRPSCLAAPTTSTIDLLLHDMRSAAPDDVWVNTHCTVPLLAVETLTQALAWFVDMGQTRYDSMISVTPLRERLYDSLGRAVNHNVHVQLPLQDLPPLYVENNAFFVIGVATARRWHNRVGLRPYLWEMDAAEAVDIDHAVDFQLAELLYQAKHAPSTQ